jgi:hypothetical protein
MGIGDPNISIFVQIVSGLKLSCKTIKIANLFQCPLQNLGLNPDGSAVNPGAFQQQLRNDSNTMAQLFQVRWMVFFFVQFFPHPSKSGDLCNFVLIFMF